MQRRVRRIDLRKLGDLCAVPKTELFLKYVLKGARPGDELLVVVGEADTWFALKNLGGQLGYEVLESERMSSSEFSVHLRVKGQPI